MNSNLASDIAQAVSNAVRQVFADTVSSLGSPASQRGTSPRQVPPPNARLPINVNAWETGHSQSDAIIHHHPGQHISEPLQTMINLRLSKSEMASCLNVSRPTLYKLFREFGLEKASTYSEISDIELNNIVKEIKSDHLSAGQIIVQGHLRAKGIHVQRRRIRSALQEIDPHGILNRSLHTIRRRTYHVKGPNFLWHLDGVHKLIKWKLVVHEAIDGFSRLLLYSQCCNNNRSVTVLALFNGAREIYGNPLRVRTDQGRENQGVWNIMNTMYEISNKPVVIGSSVHNQRIERMHRDTNEQVLNHFYNLFEYLESMGKLNPENETDIFCLHYVFIPFINKALSEFVLAHNNHSISTEKSRTPLQLFSLYFNIRANTTHPDDDFYGGVVLGEVDLSVLPFVEVPAINNPLSDHQFLNLQSSINPLLYCDPTDAYYDTVIFVGNCLTADI